MFGILAGLLPFFLLDGIAQHNFSVVRNASPEIIHRDLKLRNWVVADGQQLKLIDFGFSTVLSSEALPSDCCGTAGYLAPELVREHHNSFTTGVGQMEGANRCRDGVREIFAKIQFDVVFT